MIISHPQELTKYTSEKRIWQGIPGIEVTDKGRVFLTFYSGNTSEDIGNYCMLVKSDDDGKTFSEPVLVVYKENYRCFDPSLWIDPVGRLWLFWSIAPEHKLLAIVCDSPDAEVLKWSEIKEIGYGVMLNKPTVLTVGEWLLPVSVWRKGLTKYVKWWSADIEDGIFVYKSSDNGVTFNKIGKVLVDEFYSCDEPMITELNDSSLLMLIRTGYGIGASVSWDNGKNWSNVKNSGIGGVDTRFFISRLSSGKLLLINNVGCIGNIRSNLTAFLSDDEGATWKWRLCLDTRNDVAYPDAKEYNGHIYITYDRERGDEKKSFKEVYAAAREVLFAKITEEDIMAGEIISKNSRLCQIASKLGKYYDENDGSFNEFDGEAATEKNLNAYNLSKDEIVKFIFEKYSVRCFNLTEKYALKLDELIALFYSAEEINSNIISDIIYLLLSTPEKKSESTNIIFEIKKVIEDHIESDINVDFIATEVGMSRSYMLYFFKKHTGMTIGDYKNLIKISKAKRLLITTDMKITAIAYECGFASASYFAKQFSKSEYMTPSKYRHLHSTKK